MSVVLFCLLSFIPSIISQSRLYGPGLQASFQVPVRYFYLESRDTKGKRYEVLFISLKRINSILDSIIHLNLSIE